MNVQFSLKWLEHLIFVKRSFFNFTENQNFTVKRYADRRLVGYSKEQVYNVVANVEAYKFFLPLCTQSVIKKVKDHQTLMVDLEIGYSLFTQTYCSLVTLNKPHLVKAECFDQKLFNHLKAIWNFRDGPNDTQTCSLYFSVEFEFKSKVYRKLADQAFDKVVIQVVESFLTRARHLYGNPKSVSNIYLSR